MQMHDSLGGVSRYPLGHQAVIEMQQGSSLRSLVSTKDHCGAQAVQCPPGRIARRVQGRCQSRALILSLSMLCYWYYASPLTLRRAKSLPVMSVSHSMPWAVCL
jgi:hypothetical protein